MTPLESALPRHDLAQSKGLNAKIEQGLPQRACRRQYLLHLRDELGSTDRGEVEVDVLGVAGAPMEQAEIHPTLETQWRDPVLLG